MDSSQSSIREKRTLHKIECEKYGLFTKFNIRKMDSSEKSVSEKLTFFKFQYTTNTQYTEIFQCKEIFHVLSKFCFLKVFQPILEIDENM